MESRKQGTGFLPGRRQFCKSAFKDVVVDEFIDLCGKFLTCLIAIRPLLVGL